MINHRGDLWRRVVLGMLTASFTTIDDGLWLSASWAAPTAGTILDASGDAVSHDIESVSALFDATTMHLHATFYQGTLDPSDLAFVMFFDLDQNPATGLPSSASISTGAEVGVSFNSQRHLAEARIRGDVLPVFLGVDSFSITLPLSMLGDDGYANFGMVVGDPTSESTFFGRDFAPDGDMGRPLSTPTQFVPEPKSDMIAMLGMVCLLVGVVRVGAT